MCLVNIDKKKKLSYTFSSLHYKTSDVQDTLWLSKKLLKTTFKKKTWNWKSMALLNSLKGYALFCKHCWKKSSRILFPVCVKALRIFVLRLQMQSDHCYPTIFPMIIEDSLWSLHTSILKRPLRERRTKSIIRHWPLPLVFFVPRNSTDPTTHAVCIATLVPHEYCTYRDVTNK